MPVASYDKNMFLNILIATSIFFLLSLVAGGRK